MRAIVLFFSILLLSSCSFIASMFGGKEKPVARVYDLYLYPSDLVGIVPKESSAKDSAEIVQSYITNWMRQNVILKQAQDNAALNNSEIEEQLNNYRNSLIIYSYEQQLVAQKLDTTVTEKQIRDFYAKNKENFELKKSIIKLTYLKIPKNAHRFELAKKWFQSNKAKDKAELETYCMQFAADYSLVDTSWIYLDDVNAIIPIDRFSESTLLQKNKLIDFSDSDFYYLMKVKDFMYREDISPIEFEMDNIRNSIINKRKLELINNMENSVYNKALDEKDVEIFKAE